MSNDESANDFTAPRQIVVRTLPSAFEQLITTKPPVLESLLAQLPTESILNLYHTSSYLNRFFKTSPTSWRYISMRLHQPALQSATPTNNQNNSTQRQSSNYALDQLLLYVINPFSTRLTSLELDNTAVSGATLFQTVMVLRKDTLEHVSVRGCKNVSLKYHINPWLMMHAMALDRPAGGKAPGFEKLALKSLYTYRCRHHRRRPYLPSSLARKESDSEPTHELVLTCHRLGIWTDTAWCTTPGARCFRRRGYVTMRVPQDPREVWVVFDRLWRSRNWLGPLPDNAQNSTTRSKQSPSKQRDCRSWEVEEEAMNGEALAIDQEGKAVPAHARRTHRQFVEDMYCDNCSNPILERCEQCSVTMHCSGCRKTLCASCAFDRPYLRNVNAPEEDRNKYWWAPGCAVSPCSMQDQDLPPPGPAGNVANPPQGNSLPTIKFKWCCTEPVFSGGGGITFGGPSTRENDKIRAAPLRTGQGWEDPEFLSQHIDCSGDPHSIGDPQQIGSPLSRSDALKGPLGGRWPSIDTLFQPDSCFGTDQGASSVPRILCDECYTSEQWKIKCKACAIPLCLKHDMKDRLKVRICGYKDLTVEKTEYKSRQKALKLLTLLMLKRRKEKMKVAEAKALAKKVTAHLEDELRGNFVPAATSDASETHPGHVGGEGDGDGDETPRPVPFVDGIASIDRATMLALAAAENSQQLEPDVPARPLSPGSNSTGPPSRASSPTPSTRSIPITPEPSSIPPRPARSDATHPLWKGCQSFFCPQIRTPGDHRRRCIAMMRQCADCKVYVCEQCMTGLSPPCPCKGCRISSEDNVPGESMLAENLRFFCPNCRWTRRKSGRCKRKITEANSGGDKRKRRAPRHRKPIEQRQSYRASQMVDPNNIVRDAYDYLSDFMQSISIDEVAEDSTLASVTQDVLVLAGGSASNIAAESGSPEEIRQLEDMDALARDLILRIQTLRQQFGPGSPAARALPNIIVQDPVPGASREPNQRHTVEEVAYAAELGTLTAPNAPGVAVGGSSTITVADPEPPAQEIPPDPIPGEDAVTNGDDEIEAGSD